MNSLVSIITPSYNSEKFISSCIKSVISQTYTNWEMIIVDDFSSDNTILHINKLASKEKRIKAFFLDNNVGAAEARNIALRKGRGDYIAFIDSDDCWHPKKLEKQITFMQKNNIAFSYTSYQVMSEDGLSFSNIIRAPYRISYQEYLKNTIIGCLTVIIDKNKVGYFEMPNIRSSHDMALWLLIMKRGFNAYGLNENLAQYRLVSSSNTSNKLRSAYEVWKIYRQVENLSFGYSIWCFLHYFVNAIIKRL